MLYEFCEGVGRHKVTLVMWNTAAGWIGSLTGGDLPHVGGVVLAAPRKSLTGEGMSADVWRIPVPGHLDDEAAAPIAKRICGALGVPVSLTCGIHIDRAAAADIALIRDNCDRAAAAFLKIADGG